MTTNPSFDGPSAPDRRAATDRHRAVGLPTSRRALLGVGAGVASTLMLAGCGGARRSTGGFALATPILGSPVAQVPGYADPAKWAGRTVRVAAFGGEVQSALRQVVWDGFAAATGCRVVDGATDYAQLQASIAGGAAYTDLMLADAFWAHDAGANGQVQALPPELAARFPLSPFPITESSAPAFAYAMVGAYRSDAVKAAGPPRGWSGWWDATTYGGARTLPRAAFGSFEAALLADGVDARDLYPLDSARAVESLKRISGKIVDLWWDSGLQPTLWLTGARVDFAAAWHHRVVAAQLDGRPVDFTWEQGLLVADRWVIPAGSPAPEIAADLIAFSLSAEAQAALALAAPMGPVNAAAFDRLQPRVSRRLPTFPENLRRLVTVDAAWWAAHGTEANEHFNSWLLGVPAPTATS